MQLITDEIKRSSLTRLFWKQGQRVLLKTQQSVIDVAGDMDIDSLKQRVPKLMKPDYLSDYITDLWIKTGSIFAVDTLKRIERMTKKANENIDYWEDYFRLYIRERSVKVLGLLMDSQTKIVNGMIDKILEDGIQRGLGIPEIQRNMRRELVNGLTEINKYQAERIARTEVMSSSNKGSYDAAVAEDYEIKKLWFTSHLPGIRPTHLAYEALGEVDMKYKYAPGLLFPCDPNGSAEEIVNCRCTIIYNVDV